MTNRASEEKFGTIPFTEEEKSNLEQKLARSLHKDYVSTRSAGAAGRLGLDSNLGWDRISFLH